MEGWGILIAVIVVIVLAIKYWYITLALGAFSLVIYMAIKVNKAAERREAAEVERKAKKDAYLKRCREDQLGYREHMVVLGKQSIDLFESLPKHLSSAEKYLDQAEIDFADGAFAPFWDSIENAAKTLGRFDEGVRHIKDNSSRYTPLIRNYEDTPPHFPLVRQSVVKLGVVGTPTAERMKAIVRTAQCNYHFASIYQQY